MAILESTSNQTDFATSFWALASVYLRFLFVERTIRALE